VTVVHGWSSFASLTLAWELSTTQPTISLPALPRSHRCGSCANESAFKAAFMTYRHRQRQSSGEPEFTPEEMSSCMRNAAPGSPDLTVLSFTSAFHGRLFGSLSATRSKAIHKVRCELLRPGIGERRTDRGHRRMKNRLISLRLIVSLGAHRYVA
jgi:hypothetical protein